MKTVEIKGVVIEYVVGGNFAELLDEWQAEAREEEIDRELRAWLDTPEAKNDINYSDIFKDVYGYRPRW